jgi:hypothetical protein
MHPERPVIRMTWGLALMLVLVVVGSVSRGDSPFTTATHALVGLGCGGFVIACYLWSHRRRG